jgi:hypothetical protein
MSFETEFVVMGTLNVKILYLLSRRFRRKERACWDGSSSPSLREDVPSKELARLNENIAIFIQGVEIITDARLNTKLSYYKKYSIIFIYIKYLKPIVLVPTNWLNLQLP